ncbi:MAG TPA: nitroreductase [Candidatus Hydrogenedentes bacterium]|nr:nitroreductase [Candidatus Hydrogenedentota bacterium]
MADFMDIITGRRSTRKYEARPVADDVLEKVLEAGRWAQSWANTQCWEIVVVRDAATKEKLQGTIKGGNPSIDAIVAAPVLLAVCGKTERAGYYKGMAVTKFGDWLLFDLGVLSQNIALAAHALGLASVVVGLFDHEAAREVLGVPDGHEVVTLMPLGYPAGSVEAPPRREVSDFTHYDAF